ncbi:cob(I)yrinic acid a,c-diamide adenosyltransferase [Novosphingopyxis sp. YJ-S2-01]|uniref:cob(I)yrinic acid a,c-diamide adenosyltransferase n=1 Tax=Novosphingopyxis sp. YJ-S2-01 TaxID=2794021 RepID=UPI0018DC45C0|nr:cob(I)yrinic acid a,c-diamide adenosyltransferase [Novosphingopyxis sp. YJ-S2-01]MBH9536741.1 cob(I)yrinic acid a,c-diamide adenosyltransferase [Novosphingopyxis sp. YJ-S2-01]
MVKLNKIYTRTGDDGSTGLVDGSRLSKSDPRMEAIGDVDEANSAIGVAISAFDGADTAGLMASLSRIQNDLFDLGADIATPGTDFEPSEMELRVVASQTAWLEDEIDRLNEALEPLTSFILPGGSAFAAGLHLARAITRRAERAMVGAHRIHGLNPEALRYINRLSDYLFTAARRANAVGDGGTGAGDVLWKPGASR